MMTKLSQADIDDVIDTGVMGVAAGIIGTFVGVCWMWGPMVLLIAGPLVALASFVLVAVCRAKAMDEGGEAREVADATPKT